MTEVRIHSGKRTLRYNMNHGEGGRFSEGDTPVQDWQKTTDIHYHTIGGQHGTMVSQDINPNLKADQLWQRISTVPHLSSEEDRALSSYSGGGYADMNNGLRFGTTGDDMSYPSFGGDESGGFGSGQHDWTTDLDVNLIDDAISRSVTSEPAVVFRGGESPILGAQPGDTFTDHGFVSTSVLEGPAEAFAHGEPMAEIQLPAGSHALYNEGASGMTGEAEVILPRDTVFEVTKVEGDRVTLKARTG